MRLFLWPGALLKSSMVRLLTEPAICARAVNNQPVNPPDAMRHKSVSGNSQFLCVNCICVFIGIFLKRLFFQYLYSKSSLLFANIVIWQKAEDRTC